MYCCCWFEVKESIWWSFLEFLWDSSFPHLKSKINLIVEYICMIGCAKFQGCCFFWKSPLLIYGKGKLFLWLAYFIFPEEWAFLFCSQSFKNSNQEIYSKSLLFFLIPDFLWLKFELYFVAHSYFRLFFFPRFFSLNP